MIRYGSLLILLMTGTGCFKNQTRPTALAPRQPLPSPLAAAQPPKPPAPVARSNSPSPSTDATEYPAVPPIPPPPTPIQLVSAADDDRKPIRERMKERREERREDRTKPPPPAEPTPPGVLPSPFAPKVAPPMPTDAPKPASGDVAVARQLVDAAAAKLAQVNDYEARLVRREVVNGKETPTEEILFQFRKPMAVYMKNIGEAGRGREVLYVDGKFNSLMHVVTGEGDNRLVGAGFKTTIKPDSPMATAKSRHRITEAGYPNTLARLEKAVKAAESGQRPNSIRSLGSVTRKEFPQPLAGIEVVIAPGDDPTLPKGGKQTVFFDVLPVLFVTTEGEREVEYYCYTQLKCPANLTDADFTPDRLGGKR